MTKSILSDQLQLAPSQLYVANLADMTAFYRNLVGLDIIEQSKTTSLLGHDQTGVIELISKPKLAYATPKEAGLFHNAVVYDSRGDLSRAAGNIISQSPELFSGTGDHLVSEAFYFNDPEGNGVELYFDRPADTWTWQNGHIQMDTLYIDPVQYIYANASTPGDSHKKLGHVHLRIGDINEARKFYVGLLGFDITAQVPGALFVSIAGYHHHIGLNTWLSQGAGKRRPTLGLSDITITLGNDQHVGQLASRLERANYDFHYSKGAVKVQDPWGNQLTFSA